MDAHKITPRESIYRVISCPTARDPRKIAFVRIQRSCPEDQSSYARRGSERGIDPRGRITRASIKLFTWRLGSNRSVAINLHECRKRSTSALFPAPAALACLIKRLTCHRQIEPACTLVNGWQVPCMELGNASFLQRKLMIRRNALTDAETCWYGRTRGTQHWPLQARDGTMPLLRSWRNVAVIAVNSGTRGGMILMIVWSWTDSSGIMLKPNRRDITGSFKHKK